MPVLGLTDDDRRAADAALRAMNDSPMQRKLRERHHWYSTCVYWNPGDYDVAFIRRECERMLEVGFNAVRFHNAMPEVDADGNPDYTRTDDWLGAAESAGIGVILHVNEGKLPPAVLANHGLGEGGFRERFADDPKLRAAWRGWFVPIIEHCREHPALFAWGGPGEPGGGGGELASDEDRRRFGRWLEAEYGTVEALDAAWAIYPRAGRPMVASFDQAWRVLEGFKAGPKISGVHMAKRCYGAGRDMLRFLADKAADRLHAFASMFREHDDEHPLNCGSHQLLVNDAALSWDIGKFARVGDSHFSSIHPSWHYGLIGGETDLGTYLQARLTRDYFKGGFASCFETTGGPVQYSGGYGTAMTPGLMRRLSLSYLASGCLGLGYWTWNVRSGAWEAGEYGLTSLSGAVTPWAEAVGGVAKGVEQYAGELWDAEPDPPVGVLTSWDTNAVYVFEPGRHDVADGPSEITRGTAQQAARARIGAGRALAGRHVPFEFVTTTDLAEGIAARYPAIYAPHLRAVDKGTVDRLRDYAEAGGRVVADVQFAFLDPWGKLPPNGPDGWQASLFGAYIDAIHDARTAPLRLDGFDVKGFFGDLVPTGARVVARYEDGRPAITEARIGRGAAVLVGCDLSMMCWQPGPLADAAGDLLARLAAGDRAPTWSCTAPLAFRRRCPAADHLFVLNDGPARTAYLTAADANYTEAVDVTRREPIPVDGTIAIPLPAEDAAWVRLERADS